MMGQADAVGQTLGGPIIGFIARQASIALALTSSALMLLPALFLYQKASRLGADQNGGGNKT